MLGEIVVPSIHPEYGLYLSVPVALFLLLLIYRQTKRPLCVEDVETDDAKGFLDHLIEGEKGAKSSVKAMEKMSALVGRHGAYMSRMTPKIETAKRGTRISRVIWPSEAVRVRRLARRTARVTDRIASKLERRVDEFSRYGMAFTGNYLKYVGWASKTEAQAPNIEALRPVIGEFRSALQFTIPNIDNYRSILSGQQIEGRLIKSNERLAVAAGSALTVMRRLSSDCDEMLNMMDDG